MVQFKPDEPTTPEQENPMNGKIYAKPTAEELKSAVEKVISKHMELIIELTRKNAFSVAKSKVALEEVCKTVDDNKGYKPGTMLAAFADESEKGDDETTTSIPPSGQNPRPTTTNPKPMGWIEKRELDEITAEEKKEAEQKKKEGDKGKI